MKRLLLLSLLLLPACWLSQDTQKQVVADVVKDELKTVEDVVQDIENPRTVPQDIKKA
jgi:hypothetical protein